MCPALYQVWDVATMQPKRPIIGLNHWVRALATSQNHLYGGSYQTIKVSFSVILILLSTVLIVLHCNSSHIVGYDMVWTLIEVLTFRPS